MPDYFLNTTYPTRHHHLLHIEKFLLLEQITTNTAITQNVSVIGTIYLSTPLNHNP